MATSTAALDERELAVWEQDNEGMRSSSNNSTCGCDLLLSNSIEPNQVAGATATTLGIVV
jgi:hypothetical protein